MLLSRNVKNMKFKENGKMIEIAENGRRRVVLDLGENGRQKDQKRK